MRAVQLAAAAAVVGLAAAVMLYMTWQGVPA